MAQKPFEFTLQFGAGIGQVDTAKGLLRGVTVAEVGPATGHFAFVDAAGKVLGVGGMGDAETFKGAVKRLQLGMDEQSLASVVTAGQKAKRFKTREDHDDSIEARAGFTENFRMDAGKVVCDQTIFDSYRNRGVFLEAATETPELIGLSGDFKFTAEVVGDKAMMRVTRIDAVDIVDQGALTHAGLFKVKSAAQVDMPANEETEFTAMAKTPPAKPDLKAFKEMCAAVAAYKAAVTDDGSEIDDCMAGLLPPTQEIKTEAVKTAAKTDKPMTPEEKTALTTELTASLSAVFTAKLAEVSATIKTEVETATKAQAVEFSKKMSALGIKMEAGKEPTPEEIAAAKKQADELAAKLKEGEKKDFLTMRAAVAAEKKISLVKAAQLVAAEHPEVFHEYRVKLGIIKAA